MPELRKHRALLAIRNSKAKSVLRGYFRSRGDVVERYSDAVSLAATALEVRPCLIVLELPAQEGLREQLERELQGTPVVLLTAPAMNIRQAPALWTGCTILELPLSAGEISGLLDQVFQSLACKCLGQTVSREGATPKIDMSAFYESFSPRMTEVRKIIFKVATTSAAVLIRGESGVGKEVAARMIFQLSDRHDKPLVKVNCAAIPSDLLESELFGYEAGAFTGAQRSKPGKFELADGGTLFLDEIAEMHPLLQAKLLHVLQDGEFARLGAKRDTTVDVRLICATNRNLEARVAEGLFREDLFYRINVITVEIPPLRERPKEIPILLEGFLKKYSELYGRAANPLEPASLEAIVGYPWPGNIRELENFSKRYVILGDASALMQEWRSHEVSPGTERRRQPRRRSAEPVEMLRLEASASSQSLLAIGKQAAKEAEERAIRQMLTVTRWNRRETARRLQVSYKALLNKIKAMQELTRT